MIRDNKMSQKIVLFVVIFLLPLAFILGFYSSKTVNVRYQRNQVESELQYLLENYAMYADDNYDQEVVLHAKLLGMLYLMEDPYADIIYSNGGTETSLRTKESSNKKIGITFRFTTYNELEIIDVARDSDAFGKIFPGDIIIGAYVNDTLERFRNKTQVQITNMLQYKNNPTIKLLVQREDQEFVFEIEYKEVSTNQYVKAEMINQDTGYIKLTQFERGSAQEFTQGLMSLENQNMEKLIIDLRDNPGGYVSELDLIIQQLVPQKGTSSNVGNAVFKTQTYKTIQDSYTSIIYANKNLENKTYLNNIAILVNENSASAAEGLTSVLQSQNNAKVIGKPTYGKDLYQTTVQIGQSDYYFKYTEGHWLYKNTENKFVTLTQQPILNESTELSEIYLEDLNIRQNLKDIEITYQNQLISERLFLEYLYGNPITNDTELNAALKRLANENGHLYIDNLYDSNLSNILTQKYYEKLVNINNDAYVKYALNYFNEIQP
ncbi:MAG: hypothetical protein GX312_01205 [Candidatus Phytoplasma sp.]|nr:hypothetical protein [Phytoplasma sp.]